jgi:hemerythrin-like metal-binding protein
MKLESFEWSEELSVGITKMDDQHKTLIEKINQLVTDLAQDDPQAYSDFKDLAGFVVEHFSDEEMYMESISYPGLATHKVIHKQLLEKVGEFEGSIRDGSVDKFKLINFLKMWLRSHIMGIDMKYGEHAQKNVA